jgi:type IV secretion system protein VirD4
MKNLLYHLRVFLSRVSAFFSHVDHLHHARFARPHELDSLLTPSLPTGGETSLLLGVGHFNQVLCVRPTKTRRELGNFLAVAPTRGGKGLLAVSELLSWPHSVVVNDIKGDLFATTAGYRNTLGPVFVIDPTGVGHQYDPLQGRETEDELYSSAKHLLFDPRDGDGAIFTQRATVQLTQLFRAAKMQSFPAFPYVYYMMQCGLREAAERLYRLSPPLATRFLDVRFEQANWEDKFLFSSWSTLSARMSFLTETVIRSLSGSDFTAGQLMTSQKPTTVYLRWPEQHLLALSPLVRLLFGSLIDDLIEKFDSEQGIGCYPVLLLIDEAGRTAIPSLADHATTVVGRGITLWIAIQALSQLETVYGKARADTLRNNMESQIYYRQASQETAEYLQRSLGYRSGFAHSHTTHEGVETSEGQAEQAVSLMTAQEIKQMGDDEIIGFHRNLPPFKAKRMDWRGFPFLIERQAIPPPPLSALPQLDERLPDTPGRSMEPEPSWRLDPGLIRRRDQPAAANGLRKNNSKDGEAGFRPQTS